MLTSSSERVQTASTIGAPARPTPVDLANTTLGRYRLDRELGCGGMGVVYEAYDMDLERRVALKILRSDANVAEHRLLREARAMARLAHANVVAVY